MADFLFPTVKKLQTDILLAEQLHFEGCSRLTFNGLLGLQMNLGQMIVVCLVGIIGSLHLKEQQKEKCLLHINRIGVFLENDCEKLGNELSFYKIYVYVLRIHMLY